MVIYKVLSIVCNLNLHLHEIDSLTSTVLLL